MINFTVEVHGLGEVYTLNCAVDPLIAAADPPELPDRMTARVADEIVQRLGGVLSTRLGVAVYG